MSDALLNAGRQTLMLELQEASRLPERLGDDFVRAANIIIHCEGKVIVSGIGKSGHIGKKIAATLASTGTPAFFVHPAEALHGDLGMIESRDVMLFISYSGGAKELDLIIPRLEDKSVALLAMTGKPHSPLGRAAKAVLDISVEREACPMHLAPTSSTVNTLMMGDALAMAVMQARGFNEEDFARSHPAGALGARLLNNVHHHLMRQGDAIPQVMLATSVMDAMLELSRTGLGLVAVCDEQHVVKGVFTDGDLRRWLVGGGALTTPVSEAMTPNGITLQAQSRAIDAVRTCHYASFTANAAFLHHMNKAFVTADGTIRANVGARRIFTLATQRCRGNVHAFDNMDTR
ncbi:phosphosugar binding protein [Salmonella enterica subsp. enterica serovar Typhi]|nr:phosphosugar binding protein [Salmonella enterica subsp. enterica serovar Typhi]